MLLKNQNGKLLPLKVPSSGAYKVAVIGYFANPSSMYLGGYSTSQGAAGVGQRGQRLQRPQVGRSTALDPDATVDYYKGFTGTGTRANQLTAVDPAAVAAAANYDAVDRLRRHRLLDRHRGPGPHHAAASRARRTS